MSAGWPDPGKYVVAIAFSVLLGALVVVDPLAPLIAAIVIGLGVMAWRSPWLLTLVAVWYVVIVTRDIRLWEIPAKVPLVAAAVIAWYVHRGPRRLAFSKPVLALALVAPLVWTLVAVLAAGSADAYADSRSSFVVEQASRFAYLLLYFPLADALREHPVRATAMYFVIPVLILAGLTWPLRLSFDLLQLSPDSFHGGEILLWRGTIDYEASGALRLFFSNHLFLISGVAFALGLWLGTRRWRWLAACALLLSVALGTYTRGIWLGIVIVCFVIVVTEVVRRSSSRLGGVLVLGSVMALVAVIAVGRLGAVGSVPDPSIAKRYEQAPQLVEAFRERPLFGAGFGATLDSGYIRSNDSPWSFELTYLQILMQMGIAGLVAILVPPGIAIARSARVLVSEDRLARSLAQAAIGGLVGVLVASGTNSFLLTSYGMLSVAMCLAAADCALAMAAVRISLRERAPAATRPQLRAAAVR